jgi:predicted DsbA family dithiol-disulfide isomerase
MPAAKYFEALRVQSPELAYKFHDEIFKNQRKLKNGEKFLKAIVKKIGADQSKLEKDLKDPKIVKKIQNDIKEANKFGIQGTPGFLINGIPVKGAYPSTHFAKIIDELKKRGKVKL